MDSSIILAIALALAAIAAPIIVFVLIKRSRAKRLVSLYARKDALQAKMNEIERFFDENGDERSRIVYCVPLAEVQKRIAELEGSAGTKIAPAIAGVITAGIAALIFASLSD